MSHKNLLRKDKTCLNCNYVVDQRYCPNCGQENADTRKSFYNLFVHFFEDLTHYENTFWKTIKNLLLKPAALTKEYLSGKRLSYLAPIRLYIFISFVTFFIITVFPNKIEKNDLVEIKQTPVQNSVLSKDTLNVLESKLEKLEEKGVLSGKEADSITQLLSDNKDKSDTFLDLGYSSIKELDSVKKANPKKISDFMYYMNTKIIPLNEKYTNEELINNFLTSLTENFPKALIIFMPLFAFLLWLFHDKKRWYYFDHGIFTLHYFSFLLLLFLIIFLKDKLFESAPSNSIFYFINGFISIVLAFWMFYYFFPAHRRFYEETKMMSFIKSMLIFIINVFFMTIILILLIFYTLINLN